MFSGPSTKRSEAAGSCNPICDGGGNGVIENRDRLQIVRSSVERYERLLNAHLSCKSKAGADRWIMVEVQLIRPWRAKTPAGYKFASRPVLPLACPAVR